MKKASDTKVQAKPASRVLPDLTKGNSPMTDTGATTDTNGTKRNKKGERILIQFIDAQGKAHGSPTSDIAGIIATAKETNTEFKLKLEQISPTTLAMLAAFGASVHLRNSVNTEPDAEKAANKMAERGAGFLKGEYRQSAVGGGALPIIFEAMERAFRAAGKNDDEITEKVAGYKALYLSGETEEEQKAAKEGVIKKLMSVKPIVAQIEVIKREREAARQAKAMESATADIDSI